MPLLPYFSHFSGYPSPAIRAFLRKTFIFLKSSLKGLSILLISSSFEELEFSTIFTYFGDQAYNRIMAMNNRTMRVQELQLLFDNDYIIDYKSAKFYCSSIFAFELVGGE